jgi:hypothetical protein
MCIILRRSESACIFRVYLDNILVITVHEIIIALLLENVVEYITRVKLSVRTPLRYVGGGAAEMYLLSFLTSELDGGGGGQLHDQVTLTLGEKAPPHQLNRRLDGARSRPIRIVSVDFWLMWAVGPHF